MWRRLGLAIVLAVFGFSLSVVVSRGANKTSPSGTSASATSTAATSTTLPVASAPTNASSTTAPTATASTAATTPAPVARAIDGGCLVIGAVALVRPHSPPLVLGPVAQAPPAQRFGNASLVYPADGSIVRGTAISVDAGQCAGKRATGRAALRSLSLFDGAVTAASVTLAVTGSKIARASSISGLQVDGKPVRVIANRRVPIGSWGYLVALARPSRFVRPRGEVKGRRRDASALLVQLRQQRAGLPARTMLLVAFATLRLPPGASANALPHTHITHQPRGRRGRSARLEHRPLEVTPPLGMQHYVFPIAGSSSFIDTYGAFRADVSGNWHHGDDIFAAVGTPVVAVATGTLNRIGWEALGGWRLWVRDRRGNEFYYAHLSGYSSRALRYRHVHAGQVIGFVGNTGDAFTTSYHLHFEVHPRSLLYLHYDGAVDPTSYLGHWTHLSHVRAPKPALPALPSGAIGEEARFVFRQLLAARGLIRHAPSISERPRVQQPGLDMPSAALAKAAANGSLQRAALPSRREQSLSSTLALSLTVAVIAIGALSVLVATFQRRRRTSDQPA